MEIINDNGAQSTNPTPTPQPKPQGCFVVAARVIMAIIFFLSAAIFVGCTIAAAVLPITTANFDFGLSGVNLMDGPIYIAELVCILCALGAAFICYLTFCIAFSKRVRGWIVALFLVLFVGGAVGGTIYGVKVGFDIADVADDIVELGTILDGVDDKDVEGIIRAVLSTQGEKNITVILDDKENFGVILGLDLDSATVERVMEVVAIQDEEVIVTIKQDIDSDGVGTREVSIRLPDEDINITQTLPLTPLPSAKAE